MYRKTEPKNKNITVRVTEDQYDEFTEIAEMNKISTSQWANHILSKHKDSYGKIEDKEKLIEGIDITRENMEYVMTVLKGLREKHKSFYSKTMPLILTEMKLTEKMIEMTKFKRRIQN
ncbi:hypothetical protein [uncultured Psychroserpens sp.]|uniref:hypothetical protein n=1 Tax=uncultured Psychroserpens sp. TaxID=255436 RepID=UPI00260A3BCE|nr:hypothetical protein [uncultured Psychroserpens sp.]